MLWNSRHDPLADRGDRGFFDWSPFGFDQKLMGGL